MASFLRAIAECLGTEAPRPSRAANNNYNSNNSTSTYLTQRTITIDEKTTATASSILDILFTAPANDKNLELQLQSLVSIDNWTENLAAAVLAGLENALTAGAPMGEAMKKAWDKVTNAAREIAEEAKEIGQEAGGFVKDHPYYCAFVAVGILVLLAPWALEALGFAELGPIEGSFAAWWQARYAGSVPKGSLFSFFQRLGMVWRRVIKG